MRRIDKPLRQELIGLLLHSLMAAIVGSIVVFFSLLVGGAADAALGLRGLLTSIWPFNPFIWLSAGTLGFVANRSMQHRAACLVGFVGLVFLIIAMHSEVSIYERSSYYGRLTARHAWQYEFQQLFSSDEKTCADSECLGRVFMTIPFLSSVAYSGGAWLWLRSGRGEKDPTTLPSS